PGAHEIGEVARRREEVSKADARRGDREHRVHRGDAQVAGDRDVEPAADAVAADRCERRLGEVVDRLQRRLGDPLVVKHRLVRRALVLELRDVVARGERLLALAGEDREAHARVARGAFEDDGQRLPDLERERVVLRGVVEADVEEPTLGPRLQSRRRRLEALQVAHQYTPADFMRASSASAKPISRRTSSECSPRFGAARARVDGVRVSVTGWPIKVCSPKCADVTFFSMPRCFTWASSKASFTLLMCPHATPAALSFSIQWALARWASFFSISALSQSRCTERLALVFERSSAIHSGAPSAWQKRSQILPPKTAMLMW